MQLSATVVTALVRVSLRYMHTPVEVLSLADLEQAVWLMTAVLYQLPVQSWLLPQ